MESMEMVNKGLDVYYNDGKSVDLLQDQLETLGEWCAKPPNLSAGQKELINNIFDIDGILVIFPIKLEPVFEFICVGIRDDSDIYDEISDKVVDYMVTNKSTASYQYYTASEYAKHIPTRGAPIYLGVYSRGRRL